MANYTIIDDRDEADVEVTAAFVVLRLLLLRGRVNRLSGLLLRVRYQGNA